MSDMYIKIEYTALEILTLIKEILRFMTRNKFSKLLSRLKDLVLIIPF